VPQKKIIFKKCKKKKKKKKVTGSPGLKIQLIKGSRCSSRAAG
jgi:hypothetical protein